MGILIPGTGVGGGAGGGEDFQQDTPPTATATGQIWLKTADNGLPSSTGRWRWNGTYWLTEDFFEEGLGRVFVTAGNASAVLTENDDFLNASTSGRYRGIPDTSLLIETIFLRTTADGVGTTINGSNSFDLYWRGNAVSTEILLASIDDVAEVSGDHTYTANYVTTGDQLSQHRLKAKNVVGSPSVQSSGLDYLYSLKYRSIHP